MRGVDSTTLQVNTTGSAASSGASTVPELLQRVFTGREGNSTGVEPPSPRTFTCAGPSADRARSLNGAVVAVPLIELERCDEHHFDPAAIDALRGACEGPGFFLIRGHGVSPALERRLEDLTKQFFALPPARKLAV